MAPIGAWHCRVSVFRGAARLIAADGETMGEGRAYLHLRGPTEQPQPVQGTLSLDWWDDARSAEGARLELADGPTLPLKLESDKISGCIQGRILRYQTDWPGTTS